MRDCIAGHRPVGCRIGLCLGLREQLKMYKSFPKERKSNLSAMTGLPQVKYVVIRVASDDSNQ